MSEQLRENHADTIIRNHVIWSMGAGLIPILIADIFAVSALQLDMIRQMCKVYDVDFSEQQGKAIVTSLTSSTIARIGARSLVKLIPGVGSYIGGAAVSVFAGASTYALGQVFKSHVESGGTILDFDPARLKKIYQEQFEKGKSFAKEWNKKAKKGGATKEETGGFDFPQTEPEASTSSDIHEEILETEPMNEDILTKLKELGELKSSGLLTAEEFEIMKKKLMDRF